MVISFPEKVSVDHASRNRPPVYGPGRPAV